MSTGERLQQFLAVINQTVYRFEVEVGLSVSAASRVIQGKQEFSTANLQRIHKRYPQLNLDWFLTGRGDMFISDQLKQSIWDLQQEIQLKREQELEAKLDRIALEEKLSVLMHEVNQYHGYSSLELRVSSASNETN